MLIKGLNAKRIDGPKSLRVAVLGRLAMSTIFLIALRLQRCKYLLQMNRTSRTLNLTGEANYRPGGSQGWIVWIYCTTDSLRKTLINLKTRANFVIIRKDTSSSILYYYYYHLKWLERQHGSPMVVQKNDGILTRKCICQQIFGLSRTYPKSLRVHHSDNPSLFHMKWPISETFRSSVYEIVKNSRLKILNGFFLDFLEKYNVKDIVGL